MNTIKDTSKLLVVIDMQNDFIDGPLGSQEAMAITPKVAEKIRNWDGEIWATQDTHEDNYMSTHEGINLPVQHCKKGTNGWEIETETMKELEANAGFTKLFEKESFGSPSLCLGVAICDRFKTVEFVGLDSDICVISNAILMRSIVPEIDISVDASCCAGVNETSHKNALEAMKMCQIKIINE